MSDQQQPEIIVRKVRVLEPMLGEIEVTLNLTSIVNQIAKDAALQAYRNHGGVTNTVVRLSIPSKAVCTPDTMATRNAYLALNQEKRENLDPTLEVLPS